MIAASLKDAHLYLGISPALDACLKRIEEGFEGLEPGHYDMDGDNTWLNCFDYTTVPAEGSTYEAHEKYGDIHIVLKGEEIEHVARPDSLTRLNYTPAEDYIELQGEAEYELVLRPGYFMVVFPEDAHKIKMQVNGPCQVRKAVLKFKI